MASKAYLNALKEIPKEIQQDVIGSISIANEIHLILKQKDLCAADLARMLNKSESEISKWLTGLHNFTFRTVRRISEVLEVDLVVTNSTKIAEYEQRLEKLQKEINILKNEADSNFGFDESLNFTVSSLLHESTSKADRYLANFIPHETNGNIKIKAETKSTMYYQVSNC